MISRVRTALCVIVVLGSLACHPAIKRIPTDASSDGGAAPMRRPPSAPQTTSIRDVRWKDHVYDLGDSTQYIFSNGRYAARDGAGQCEVCLELRSVTIGDADGDGREDALVVIGSNLGGAATMLTGYLFGMVRGTVTLRGTVEGGDRANGGLESMAVVDGDVVVRRFRGDSACCPDEIVSERWRWDGTRLVKQPGDVVESREKKPWYLQ